MTQLLKKTAARIVSFLFIAILTLGGIFTFAGCQTSTPKVTMTIEFNSVEYKISYKLYRKFYPQTVQHFIELADAGYYDGLCFHDYREGTGMFTGGYTFDDTKWSDENTRGLVEREYFSWLEAKNVTLTQSVFKLTDDGQVPTEGINTLVGEFSDNGYSIKNNEKKYGKKKDGALVMYYNSKAEIKDNKYVTVKRNSKRDESATIQGDARWYDSRDYKYNSATSLFYISFAEESKVNASYCVFGEIYNDEADDKYEALKKAIKTVIDSKAEGDEFTSETGDMIVDAHDPIYAGANLTAKYKVPEKAIVIKTVKVDRY